MVQSELHACQPDLSHLPHRPLIALRTPITCTNTRRKAATPDHCRRSPTSQRANRAQHSGEYTDGPKTMQNLKYDYANEADCRKTLTSGSKMKIAVSPA
jgi:hypothetical protein